MHLPSDLQKEVCNPMISFEEVLKKNNTQLDENQLKAVFCDQNCVVSAGAGSGKTTVLSYRFMRLVLEDKANCDQILTLTFTRKAAREMRERIHRQLLSFKDDPHIALQLAKFPDATIATLDSFCSTIVRCDSTSYGIASDFAIDDDQNKKSAIRCANALMEERVFSEGAKILAELYTPDNLIENMLVQLVSQQYYLPRKVDENLSDMLIDTVRERYYDLLASFSTLLERYASFGEAPKTMLTVRTIARTLLGQIGEGLDEEGLFDLLASSNFFFRKPGAGKGEDFAFLRETTEEFRSLRSKLCVALSVLLHQDQLARVVAFVREYAEAYQREKRKTGILTFSDVSSLAVEILKNNSVLRSYFKNKFRYIMIDEFQDNNEQQKELLYLLSEKEEETSEGIPLPSSLTCDKLFFVGDEKQSIYRFRGADVRVFKHLGEELGKVGGMAFNLDTNYRSEPSLIELYNRIFPQVMANRGEPYEADFTSLGCRKPTEGIEPTFSLLVKPFVKKGKDQGQEGEEETQDLDEEAENAASSDAEAVAVALLMVRMFTTDEYLIPSDDGPRRPNPSDMALLMRTTGNQLSFEKAFRKYSIPYTLQAARSLMLEAPANDIYALLQLTLYPSDKLSYMSALRSPFCNISDEGVYAALTYYATCSQPFTEGPSLGEEDLIRYGGCSSFFSHLQKKVQTGTLSEIVQFLWYESGYYLSLASKPEYQMYLEHFSFFHRLAQIKEGQGMSLSQFMDFIRENLGKNERLDDLDLLKEKGEGVQIMTVHKSKGLEFPIVFLGNSGSVGGGPGSNIMPFGEEMLPFFMSSAYHVTQTKTEEAKSAGLLFAEEDEKLFELAELKRLLYVALTRAETHLVISGCFTNSNRNTTGDKPDTNHLLMCCHALGIDIEDPVLQDGMVRSYAIKDIAEHSLYNKLADDGMISMQQAARWYGSSAKEADLRPLRYAVTALYAEKERDHELSLGEQLPLFASDDILEEVKQEAFSVTADFGTFVHGLCEAMILKQVPEDEYALMPKRLFLLLTARQRKVLVSDALVLCNNFLESTIYKKYVQGNVPRCEVKFFSSVFHDGRDVVVEGSIDLLIDTCDEILIIDFKTDRYRMPERHKAQLHLYMQASKRIYEKPVRGCVTYLRRCGSEEWWNSDDA
ncbi:MAG: UvrD-helicase domain-containing protein [Sphaerochaeta sp.]|nr:UvrD-helicase domain-containing protein [Sphaerochaeta sp.]